MKSWQITALCALALAAAVWIWQRDPAWQVHDADALLLLASLPFAWHAGRPWSRREVPGSSVLPWAVAGVGVTAAGLFFSTAFLLAAGWCCFAFGVVQASFRTGGTPSLQRLLPFALFAFPWILLDGQTIGWFFRYSAAVVNENVFRLLGLDVQRTGVYLTIDSLQLRVEAECAGLNNLQAMLLAGGVLAWRFLGQASALRYWSAWLFLPLLAWLANAVRIFCLGIAGLSYGTRFASGAFHQWGGWVTLCLMFLLAMGVFRLMARRPAITRTTVIP